MQHTRGKSPAFASPDEYTQARNLLETANYTELGIAEALKVDKRAPPRTGDPILIRRTAGGSRLDTLLRLFLICIPVEREAVCRALHPMELEQWVDAGLIRVENGMASAALRLSRLKHLVLAHDFRLHTGEHWPDFVMGIGGATRTQAMTTVRKRCSLALDMGTGSGVLAFLAADHCDRVYAVDRNARAIGVARFNAMLNGITNVEFRQGSFFEPVENLQFDLVVADPPFVISPPSEFLYLHGGMRGDQFCRKLAFDASRQLRECGYFQMLFNWAHYTGRDASEDLATWFEGNGCDTWILRLSTQDAASYASTWIEHIYGEDRGNADPLFNQWMNFYETEGIEAMSLGLVTMQRCSKRVNWIAIEDAPLSLKEECGPDIEERFECRDCSANNDDVHLLDVLLRCSPNVRLQYRCEPDASEWRMTESELLLDRALPFSVKADPFTAGLLVRCDGQTSIRNLLPDFANAVGSDVETVTPVCLKSVRQLLERGFLRPA